MGAEVTRHVFSSHEVADMETASRPSLFGYRSSQCGKDVFAFNAFVRLAMQRLNGETYGN
jgi:hypothetical protein